MEVSFLYGWLSRLGWCIYSWLCICVNVLVEYLNKLADFSEAHRRPTEYKTPLLNTKEIRRYLFVSEFVWPTFCCSVHLHTEHRQNSDDCIGSNQVKYRCDSSVSVSDRCDFRTVYKYVVITRKIIINQNAYVPCVVYCWNGVQWAERNFLIKNFPIMNFIRNETDDAREYGRSGIVLKSKEPHFVQGPTLNYGYRVTVYTAIELYPGPIHLMGWCINENHEDSNIWRWCEMNHSASVKMMHSYCCRFKFWIVWSNDDKKETVSMDKMNSEPDELIVRFNESGLWQFKASLSNWYGFALISHTKRCRQLLRNSGQLSPLLSMLSTSISFHGTWTSLFSLSSLILSQAIGITIYDSKRWKPRTEVRL